MGTLRAALVPVLLACAVLGGPLGSRSVRAAEAPACGTVRMSSPGWSDLEATDDIAGLLLRGLGYQQNVDTLSVAITYQALSNGQIDVFLGDWSPAHDHFTQPLLAAGKIERLERNLSGAKYTLVVPDYVAAAGVRTFADLAAHGDQFHHRIYGIDAGSPGNESIEKAIAGSALEGWEVVPSSEQGMLAQVARDIARKRWVVFLGWEPHPMNSTFKLVYLAGGDAFFGPNYGGGTVYTVARSGFSRSCPNVAHLLRQLSFSVPAENEMMAAIDEGKQSGAEAAAAYLKAHPEVLPLWLDGVFTRDGRPGLPAVKASLGSTG
ncbi:MAG TPA: choline ABC transporter substrate-binding protein [Steroidobacteraceae bacterium]|nr:choline ABC transporter substrate-binding protein [Steroidobacteraceae bacterium]